MAGTKSEFCEDNRSIVTLRIVFAKTVSCVLFGSLSRRGGPREIRREALNIVTMTRTSPSDTFPLCERLATFLKFDVNLSGHLREHDFFLFLLLYRAFIFILQTHLFHVVTVKLRNWKQFVIMINCLLLQFTLRSLKSLGRISDGPLPETLRNVLYALSHVVVDQCTCSVPLIDFARIRLSMIRRRGRSAGEMHRNAQEKCVGARAFEVR